MLNGHPSKPLLLGVLTLLSRCATLAYILVPLCYLKESPAISLISKHFLLPRFCSTWSPV